MSGPKCYTPPPRYSLQVFDGKLNEIFRLQSKLSRQRGELEASCVSDARLDIHFDCCEDLRRRGERIKAALVPPVFNYRGTFGQETYNEIEKEIKKRIADLQTLLNETELLKHDFAARQKDYESFRAYLMFYENSKISFADFKNQIRQYLKKNLEPKSPELFADADAQVSRVEFERRQAAFEFGFERRAATERQTILNHILEREKIIYDLKDKTSDKLRSAFQSASRGDESAEERNVVVGKIENLIHRCDHAEIKKGYERELSKLTASGILQRDTFFFNQLHDAILEAERTRHAKAAVADVLKRANESEFHQSIETEKRCLANLCFSLLDKSSVAAAEIDNLRLKLKQAEKLSRERVEEDEIASKERLFLKSQIVNCLENLGYEVMDDLEVIDFEKENDFLLKIKNQENYLNLKFKPDGSMRYVFQIPENENELSADRQKQKLHEMSVTCDEFKSVLRDLAQMGLKINLESERPVAAESIVSVPRNLRDRIKVKTKGATTAREELQEKFLD